MVPCDHAWTGSTGSGLYRCAHRSCSYRNCCHCSAVAFRCRIWAGRGWAPIGAIRYVPLICTRARTMRWSVRTGMRPRTCTWAICMSLGAKMKSIMDLAWACSPPRPRPHGGVCRVSPHPEPVLVRQVPQCVFVKVAQQDKGSGVLLYHVVEPVRNLSFWPLRGGVHHPDSDQVLLELSHRQDEHIFGRGLGLRRDLAPRVD